MAKRKLVRADGDDRGSTGFAMMVDEERQAIIIQFHKPIRWFGLTEQEALTMRDLLDRHINQLRGAVWGDHGGY